MSINSLYSSPFVAHTGSPSQGIGQNTGNVSNLFSTPSQADQFSQQNSMSALSQGGGQAALQDLMRNILSNVVSLLSQLAPALNGSQTSNNFGQFGSGNSSSNSAGQNTGVPNGGGEYGGSGYNPGNNNAGAGYNNVSGPNGSYNPTNGGNSNFYNSTGGGYNYPTASSGGVQFGANGHPTWGGSSYQNLSPDQQMQDLKSMGLTNYAIDFNSNNAAQDQQLLDAAKRNGINVQVNLGVDHSQLSNYQDAYQAAFQEGSAVAAQVGGQAKYFQLDNELDKFVDPNGTGQIDPQKYQVAAGIIQGLNAGVKSADPNAQTIVNTTEAPSGIAFLKQLQQDGVNWDVTGYHWYSQTGTDINTTGSTGDGGGTTLANVHALGKPIWITEFNGSPNGAQGPSANREQNAQIVANEIQGIQQNAQQYGIIGANVHELMDEPERNSAESQYGVLDGYGNATATSQAIQQALASNAAYAG